MNRALIAVGTVSALAVGLTSPATAAIVMEANPNGTLATAQNLDGNFSLDADPNIDQSTVVPHVTVQGGSNFESEFDYYKFTVGTANSTGFFDIDGALGDPSNNFGFDSYLRLFDSNGLSLSANDDAGNDPGSFHPWDSRLTYNFSTPGVYAVRVGSCCESPRNGQYRLHVSLQNAQVNSAVPEPSTWAMMLLGFGAVGFGMRRRREGAPKMRVRFAL